MDITSRQLDNFWRKVSVKKFDECWEWQGARNKIRPQLTYGWFRLGNRMRLAHCVSWIINCGDIPKELHVLHKCDNPPCVNPRHLWLGTQQENVKDMFSKGRKNHKGENHPQSKLKEKQVEKIKTMYRAGNHSYTELACIFQMSKGAINHILNSRSWKYS